MALGPAITRWLVAVLGVALLLYESASTAFLVPYGALGMELTDSYSERTRLFGYRHVIAAGGSIAGLAAVYLLRTAEEPRLMAFGVSAFGGIALSLTILFSVRMLPERNDYRGRGGSHLLQALGDVFRNPMEDDCFWFMGSRPSVRRASESWLLTRCSM